LTTKDTGLERYQSMESNAGLFFLVLLAVSVASWMYFEPEPVYPLSCLVVGAFVFLSNLKSAHGKIGAAFVLAAVAIVGGTAFIPADLGTLGSVVIAGSHIGLSMFGLIHARKRLLSRQGAGRGS
jgi:predicted ABC-type sugar transport system permease subunit